jgi:cytidyltransferase-like protein
MVTTFLRDELLVRCIDSIRKFYPDISVFVGDNGNETEKKTAYLKSKGCRYFRLPFDLGVSGVRNETLKLIPDVFDYIMIVEDDCVFTEKTDLTKYRDVLDHDERIGLCGGTLILKTGKEQHYEAKVYWEDGVHYIERDPDPPAWETTAQGTRFKIYDLILNVFLMRRKVWLDNPWDEQFKTALEHCDFFMGLQRNTKWTVAYTPDSEIKHLPEAPGDYQKYRARPVGWSLFRKKWGLDYVVSDYNAECPLSYEAMGEEKTVNIKGDALRAAVKALNSVGVTWWLEAGSCLGAVREKGFIPHDSDIDIGIHPKDLDKWGALREAFDAAGFKHYRDWEWKGQQIEQSFHMNGVKTDLFFFRDAGELWWHGAFGPDEAGMWSENAVFLPHTFPAYLFQNLDMVKVSDIPCFVPNPPEKYLLHRYGPRWVLRNRAYRFWLDCKAIDKNFFKKTKKTVFIGGVWDLFHSGHLNILERSKRLGAKLVVGVLTDEAAMKYKPQPIIPYADRKRIIESLQLVDEVMRQNDKDPTEDLGAAKIKPAYIIHGDDWDVCPGEKYVRAEGGKAVSLPYTPGISTTDIKKRILGTPDSRRSPISRKDRVAVLIKTFLREDVLTRTVAAVKKMMPCEYRIYIADDGTVSDRKAAFYQKLRDEGHVVVQLAYNSGISAGRNALLRIVNEDYVLLIDDDTCVSTPASFKNMKAVLDADADVALVSPLLKREGGSWFGPESYSKGLKLELQNGLLKRSPATGDMRKVGEIQYRYADQVPNVFLAKREAFNAVRWDDRIKVEYEHMDFFLALKKTTWRAAVCFDAEGIHFISEPTSEYNQARRTNPSAYFYAKWGIGNISNQF